MAEEVVMTPVDAAEPPKADPLAKPAAKLPTVGGLKPGLKLPPKPGATVALKPGIKLPPKPGATVSGLRPGLNLPPKPGATVALKPGLKLPPKPVIRKPGSTVVAAALPKPVTPGVAPAAAAKPAVPAPAAPAAPAAAAKPVSVDAQGVGKLPTVEAKAVDRNDAKPVVSENPKPLEALKSVTQKLKGITQEIPQQAILRKTGIIADAAMTEAQKEAAKHKTARISLSDAMGVAPVKNENAPMKTIRIKRPVGIPGATAPLAPQPKADAAEPEEAETQVTMAPVSGAPAAPTITQRKTLKIARPGGGAVRPAGKFGIKRPSQATTVVQKAPDAAAAAPDAGAVADIPEIPDMPAAPMPMLGKAAQSDGPAWLWTLSALVQAAACVAIGALAWQLYQNVTNNFF